MSLQGLATIRRNDMSGLFFPALEGVVLVWVWQNCSGKFCQQGETEGSCVRGKEVYSDIHFVVVVCRCRCSCFFESLHTTLRLQGFVRGAAAAPCRALP